MIGLTAGIPARAAQRVTFTLGQMIEEVERAMGTEVKRDLLPAHEADLYGAAADIGAARDRPGYAPSTTFEEGVGEFVSWFKGPLETTGPGRRPCCKPAPGASLAAR